MATQIFTQLARQDFERAVQQVFWRDMVGWLTRKSNHLQPLDPFHPSLLFREQRSLGLQSVPIDQIVGSIGRYTDFDRAFFPRQSRTKDRWISIGQACYRHAPLPPVDLIKVGRSYFVRDGHHRISVARVQGRAFIEAYVTEIDPSVSTEPEMC